MSQKLHDLQERITKLENELQSAKSKLTENEENYKLLHQNSGFGVGYYTIDGKVISYNKVAAKNMGGQSDDFEGKSIFELFPKEQADEYFSRLQYAITNNDSREYIDKVELPSKIFWFKSIYTNIYNSSNEIIGVQIISDDITKTKLLENKLKLITNALDNSLNAFDIVDDKGNIIYANQSYVKMWGYDSAEEIIGTPASNHCKNAQYAATIIDQTKKLGTFITEFTAKRKDGSLFEVMRQSSHEIDKDGKDIFPSSSLNITERNKTRGILQESEEKFRSFVDYTANGIAIVNEQGKIAFVNKSFCEIFGIHKTDVDDKYAWEVMTKVSSNNGNQKELLALIKKDLLKLLSQKENIKLAKNATLIKQSISKKERNIEETVFSFDTSMGKNLGIIVRDTTDIKNAEEEIISTYRLLQDTEKISLSGSWTYNPITETSHWSKGAYDLRGAPYESSEKVDVFKRYIHPDDEAEYYNQFDKNLNSNKSSFLQIYRLITVQNEIKTISANYEVKRDNTGKPTLVIGIDKDITEIEEANKAIQEQEERYKTLSDATFESIFISQDGIGIDQNETARKVFGYTDEEAIGRPIMDWLAPESRELVKEKIGLNKPVSYKVVAQRKDGSQFPCEIQTKEIFKDGKKLRLTAIKDISSTVLAEKALKKSEERFNLAMEATHDGLFDWNFKTNEIYYSPGWKRMLGYADHELENEYKVMEQLTHPDDINKPKNTIDSHLRGEKPRCELEFRMKHKKGHWVDIYVRFKIIVSKDNKPLRIIGTHVDISEKKKIEKLLQFQKRISQQYLEIAGVMFIALDTEQNVVLVNQKGCEILGYSEEEILGKNWFDHFLPQDKIQEVRNIFNQALKNKKEPIEYFENSIITKNGEERIIAWYNSALRDENGKIIKLVSSGTDITEKAITQKALSESEERLRLALDSSKQGIYDLNVQTSEAKVNDSYAIMMGYKPENFVETKEKWLKRIHPNDYNYVVNTYSDYIEEKIPEYRVEFRIKTKQGKWKWILSLGSIVEYTEEGKPLRMLGTHTDINEIKATQIALKNSEEKYRAMYDNAPLGYQSLDTNGDLLDVNPTWSHILGFEKDEVIGKNFGSFLHPSQVKLFQERFPKFKAAGNVKDVIFKMVKKDGTNIDVSYEGCAGYTPEGQFKQTYCTFKEITEEVKAKEALLKAKEAAEKSEHYSKTIAKLSKEIINSELSLDMIAKLTYNNSLILTNSEFGFVTSIDPETGDNIGHTLSEMMKGMCNINDGSIIFPIGPDGYPSLWGHALNTHKGFFTNQPNKHAKSQGLPKGHVQLKNFLSVPVLIKTKLVGQIALANKKGGFTEEDLKIVEEIGNLYGLAIYRKNTEKELISAKERAEESDELKSAFLANMSHEIRTPMNGIMGFAELLKEPDLTLDERDRFLGIIQKSGDRMLNIINDLIDISKIEAQQMEVFKENTEINTQIEYLHTFFKPEAEKKNIELSYNTGLNDKEAIIFSDREKIYAILTNLIKNAIKYTKQGKIEFGYTKIENHLEFYVKDTGIGIQHSKLDSIFDRFIQADLTSSTEYEGAGLGLAITKAYIELLGGNIWLDSEVDKGSTFTFTLPISPL